MRHSIQSTPPSLREIYTAAGYTRHGFSKALGVDHKSVRDWETGKHRPQSQQLGRLATFFKKPLALFIDIFQHSSPLPFQQLRIKAEYTQRQLAKELGVSVNAVMRCDQGKVRPSIWMVYACADVYNKAPNEIAQEFYGKPVGDLCPCGCDNPTVLPPRGQKPKMGGGTQLYVQVPCAGGCGKTWTCSQRERHLKFCKNCSYKKRIKNFAQWSPNAAISEARARAGLTELQLAREVGVLMVTVRAWERRGVQPTAENVRRLERIFNWTLEEAVQNCWGEKIDGPCEKHKDCPARKTFPERPDARCMDFKISCRACGKPIFLRGDYRYIHSRSFHRQCMLPALWRLSDDQFRANKRCTGYKKFGGGTDFVCKPNDAAQETGQCLRCRGAKKLHDLRVKDVRMWFRRNRKNFLAPEEKRAEYLNLTGFKRVMDPLRKIRSLDKLAKLHKAAITLADKYELPALRGVQNLQRGGKPGHGKCKIKNTSRSIGRLARLLIEGVSSPFRGYCWCGKPIISESPATKYYAHRAVGPVAARPGVKKNTEAGKRHFTWAFLNRAAGWTQQEIGERYSAREDTVGDAIKDMIDNLATLEEDLVSRRYWPIVRLIVGTSPDRDRERFRSARGFINPNFTLPIRRPTPKPFMRAANTRIRGSGGRFLRDLHP
ncbi:MAG TPA: helix-turn-helix transcriptional regulator [Candidatus Binatia bacterium]